MALELLTDYKNHEGNIHMDEVSIIQHLFMSFS